MSNRRLVCGVGVNDWVGAVKVDGKTIWEYTLWTSMIERCFGEKLKQRQPTYEDVTCSKEWLSMTKFIEDVSQMKGYNTDGWQLDKDIILKGNKLYSKDACCFVPKEVNMLLVKCKKLRGEWPIGVCFNKTSQNFMAYVNVNGKRKTIGYFKTPEEAFQAYKAAKESQIKVVANRYKDQLDPRVYEALMNYTVEIDD